MALFSGASTVVFAELVSRRLLTLSTSRANPAKMLMMRWLPITSLRMTLPFGGPEGAFGPSAGSWMPGFIGCCCCCCRCCSWYWWDPSSGEVRRLECLLKKGMS